jgi:hypothetical protein
VIGERNLVLQTKVQSPLREKVECKRGFDDGDENFRMEQMWKELAKERVEYEENELAVEN